MDTPCAPLCIRGGGEADGELSASVLTHLTEVRACIHTAFSLLLLCQLLNSSQAIAPRLPNFVQLLRWLTSPSSIPAIGRRVQAHGQPAMRYCCVPCCMLLLHQLRVDALSPRRVRIQRSEGLEPPTHAWQHARNMCVQGGSTTIRY